MVLALFVVVLGVGVAGSAMLRPGRNGDRPHSAAVPVPVSLTTVEPSVPASSPSTSHVTWQDVVGMQLPVSATAGPRCQAAGLASCFTQDDDGAALAAVHLLVRTFPFAGSKVFGPTIANQVIGDSEDALARQTLEAYHELASASPSEVASGGPLRADGGEVAGYRMGDGSGLPGHRVVYVLIRSVGEADSFGFSEYECDLAWINDDWRLVAPAWGDWRSAAQAIDDPDPARYRAYDAIGVA